MNGGFFAVAILEPRNIEDPGITARIAVGQPGSGLDRLRDL